MSKYYDDGPFTLEQWNRLIRDVNDILQNPQPSGSNCQPVDPLEEATAPHVWKVQDVTEVREKLKETCSDISFSADTAVWRRGIIDEIEQRMKDAWCHCTGGGPETVEGDCPPHFWQELLASPYGSIINYGNGYEDAVRCCGNLVKGSPCAICVGEHCAETIYTGEYYDCHYSTLVSMISEIGDDWGGLYKTAYRRTYDYIAAVNHEMIEAKDIEKYQGLLDPVVTQIDALIETIKASPNGQVAKQAKSQLHSLGPQADYLQTQVDLHVKTFAEQDALRSPAQTDADAAAQSIWSLCMALPQRFPVDANLAHDINGVLKDMPWAKWFDPNTDEEIGDLGNYALNSWGSWSNPAAGEVRPCFLNSLNNPAKPGTSGSIGKIRLSPGGYPFCSSMTAALMNRDYGIPYVVTQARHRCEGVLWVTCGNDPGNCNFYPWGSETPIYWSQGCADPRSWSSWLWIPITKPDAGSKGSEAMHYIIMRIKGRMGTDNTKKQNDYWRDHLDWYKKHPQYDHRHTQYW